MLSLDRKKIPLLPDACSSEVADALSMCLFKFELTFHACKVILRVG